MTDATEVPTGAPAGFVPHTFRHAFTVAHPRERVWRWLNDPATFVDSQVWPWRVEVLDHTSAASSAEPGAADVHQHRSAGFEPGLLNVHHGPFMVFAGVIGEIRPLEYRDLRYCYGSYAGSLRLARPTRLQFWVDARPEGTRVTLQVDALIRPWLSGPSNAVQSVFWRRFARWMDTSLRREGGDVTTSS